MLVYKSDSCTKVSNVIFIDSPVGTGFSYSKIEQGYSSSDNKAVNQILIFLTKWLDEHLEFLSNPLYIASDSYCGKEVGNGPALNLKMTGLYSLEAYLYTFGMLFLLLRYFCCISLSFALFLFYLCINLNYNLA